MTAQPRCRQLKPGVQHNVGSILNQMNCLVFFCKNSVICIAMQPGLSSPRDELRTCIDILPLCHYPAKVQPTCGIYGSSSRYNCRPQKTHKFDRGKNKVLTGMHNVAATTLFPGLRTSRPAGWHLQSTTKQPDNVIQPFI
jgi:hypothetical protein